jgi:hypothetical protein
MKLILHAGMPKAGSSALQATFARAHFGLLKKGVLYPLTEHVNQNFAVAGVVVFDRLPRVYKQAYAARPQTLQPDFERYWQGIKAQVQRHRPHTLVLSGEAFYRKFSTAEVGRLKALFGPLAETIEVVIYVRRPSEYYLSSVQQSLRASHDIKSVRPVKYRAAIEPYLTGIADKTHVIPFVRDALYHNDIAADFAGRLIPECLAEVEAAAVGPLNETVSAEAMSVLQSYRLQNHSELDDIRTRDTGILLELLRQTERDAGLFTRPKLKAEVAETIDAMSRDDVVWLKESFGVSFDGLDVSRLNGVGRRRLKPHTVESICEVDREKRDRLLMLVLRQSLRDPSYYNLMPQWLLNAGRRTSRRIRATTAFVLHNLPFLGEKNSSGLGR